MGSARMPAMAKRSRGSMRPRAGPRSIRSSAMSATSPRPPGSDASPRRPGGWRRPCGRGPSPWWCPRRPDCGVAELATAGLPTIALRVPDHPVALAILAKFGKPVVAPSANRSGHVSPTTAAHVLADLRGRIDLIVDGGRDAGRAGNPPSWPASIGRSCCGPAACRAPTSSGRSDTRCRSRAGNGDRGSRTASPRWRRASSPPTMRRGAACASSLKRSCRRGVARLRAGAAAGRGRRRAGPEPVGARRPDRGGGQSVFAPARARCPRACA